MELTEKIYKMIAEEHNVEFGERFTIRFVPKDGVPKEIKNCYILPDGFYNGVTHDKFTANTVFSWLEDEYFSLIKQPWIPKEGDIVYFYGGYSNEVLPIRFCVNDIYCLTMWNADLLFKSKEEAEKDDAAKNAYEQLVRKYKDELPTM